MKNTKKYKLRKFRVYLALCWLILIIAVIHAMITGDVNHNHIWAIILNTLNLWWLLLAKISGSEDDI